MNAPDPCSRCGSACEAVRGPVPDRWGVRCLECGLWADDRAATEAEAIAAWNRRAALPARGVGVPTDPRPANCRFRLKDEGKPYGRSSCSACGKSVFTGLGNSCSNAPTDGEAK